MMGTFRRNQSSISQENLNGSELQRRKDFSKKVAGNDENAFPLLHNGAPTKSQDLKTQLKKNALFTNTSSAFKKILAERKEDTLPDSSLSPYLEITPQSKFMPCSDAREASFHISPISSHSYNPITNYTSPRPKFLRYNPNQRRELLQRLEGERRGDEEVRSASSLSSPNASSKRGNDSDYEEEEELEKKERPLYSCVLWSLLLIFGVFLFISYRTSSGSYPSFEGYESSADNVQKIQGKAPLRLVGKSLFPKNLFGSMMSLSQMCPIVSESACNLEENCFVSLKIDGFIEREHQGDGESLVEGIRSDLSDKKEVLVAEFHNLFRNNGGLADDDSVVEEKEYGGQDQRYSGPLAEEVNANKSISEVETLKEINLTISSVESLLVPLAQDVSDSSSTIRDDKFYDESLDSIEFSSTTQSREDEDFKFSLTSDTELKSDSSSNILSEGVLRLFSIFLCALTIAFGLLSGFQKYFRRPYLNSLHVFPSPSSSELCLTTETEEKIVTAVPMKEQNHDKALDILVESKSSRLNAVHSPLDHINDDFKEVTGYGPPKVELLGEFSLIDAGISNNGLCSNLKKMEYPNSDFSCYQKGRARKMLSPSPYMLDSSASMESTSSRFSSKVFADKSELSDTSSTALRRSSRLRNRVTTSP